MVTTDIYLKKFCVYITWIHSTFDTPRNEKLPPFYIGSGDTQSILEGKYFGSVSSDKYKDVWINELKYNRECFSCIIIEQYDDRKEAFAMERELQLYLNVVPSPFFINKSVAIKQNEVISFPWNKGINGFKVAEKTKSQISKTMTGVKKTPEHRENMKGRQLSEATLLHLSEINSGPNNPMYGKTNQQPLSSCIYCKVTGGTSNLKRWHFDNCKQNPKSARKNQ